MVFVTPNSESATNIVAGSPDSVVERQRHLRDMQETMVQLHPGLLNVD